MYYIIRMFSFVRNCPVVFQNYFTFPTAKENSSYCFIDLSAFGGVLVSDLSGCEIDSLL